MLRNDAHGPGSLVWRGEKPCWESRHRLISDRPPSCHRWGSRPSQQPEHMEGDRVNVLSWLTRCSLTVFKSLIHACSERAPSSHLCLFLTFPKPISPWTVTSSSPSEGNTTTILVALLSRGPQSSSSFWKEFCSLTFAPASDSVHFHRKMLVMGTLIILFKYEQVPFWKSFARLSLHLTSYSLPSCLLVFFLI